MLRKIDCVMIYVDALEATRQYYIDVLGRRLLW
jgi:catechol 2,3-dioxygenase-like lactoylglutathione lyase family enzyme